MDQSDENGYPMSYYPVTDYSAKGDGETDDSAPIQAALDDVNPLASTDGDGDDGGDVDPTGSRSDDGSTFTGDQTNQIDLSVTADKPVRVRDQVPVEWTVVEGDAHVVYEESGTKYIEFGGKKKTADVTYLAEAPSGLTDSKTYTFGPIEASHEGEWVSVDGTADDNVVVGEET